MTRPVLAPRVAALLLLLVANAVAYGKMIVAYVPNWIDLGAFSTNIDYAKITHINIAFENPVNAEGDLSFNQRNIHLIDRAREKGVKILVSIGGGAAAEEKRLMSRYFDLLSATNRSRFVGKLARYVDERRFDGLDVDIEGPSINEDYGAFISDLARALKPKGKLLTAALSQGYGGSKVPSTVFADFDFINIMAYDATGAWNPKAPGPHSSMEFARKNVAYWLNRGLPKSKAVLGVPFYGYGFGKDFRKSSYSYAEIVRRHPGAEKLDQVGETIWYNGIPTMEAKARFVLEAGLAGMMIWSLNNDGPGEKSLLGTMHRTLATSERAAP